MKHNITLPIEYDKTTCGTCRHWKGNKHSEWGDCYRYATTIKSLTQYDDRFGNRCRPPLDPHDVLAYYWPDSLVRKRYSRLNDEELAPFVRVRRRKEMTMVCDNTGELKRVRASVTYLQTHKTGECELYDATNTG